MARFVSCALADTKKATGMAPSIGLTPRTRMKMASTLGTPNAWCLRHLKASDPLAERSWNSSHSQLSPNVQGGTRSFDLRPAFQMQAIVQLQSPMTTIQQPKMWRVLGGSFYYIHHLMVTPWWTAHQSAPPVLVADVLSTGAPWPWYSAS